MIRTILCACLVCLPAIASAGEEAVGAICVLEGPDVQPMKDGLRRIQRPFSVVGKLEAGGLGECRVLVLCGADPPVDENGKKAIEAFLEGGGAVLAVGGGATAMVRQKLFDATTYYFTGTTIHMTVFHGYHRLTFGYPGAKPVEDWKAGVPNLLRATQGPLMGLGPKAISILGYDGAGLYSAAAFQRVGKGLVLMIGPDPQGGNAYYSLDKPTLEPGDKLQTDLLLANAIAFLLDPRASLIPNGGFEANMDLPPEQCNWQVALREGARREWRREGAPEGSGFLRIECPQAQSSGMVEPTCPIVVERGVAHRFTCRYRASIPWTVEFVRFKGSPPAPKRESAPPVSVAASPEWRLFTTDLTVPADVSYPKPVAAMRGQGELCLDDVGLRPIP